MLKRIVAAVILVVASSGEQRGTTEVLYLSHECKAGWDYVSTDGIKVTFRCDDSQ